ncbi:MAG: Smr/MutS family protein [Silicimonas sp.]|jgi:DNA-nicking Smr family endonuclease|nr:Smr/MutS family protein [Silicimonas sp.]
MTRKGRRLSPEEERLWKKITDTTTPFARRQTIKPLISKGPVAKGPPEKMPVPAFRVGENTSLSPTETRIVAPDQPLRMDRKAFAKMKRGKSDPEARIDLHGMTVDRAHSALLAFLVRSHSEGKRLVLVITGKGRKAGDEHFAEPPPGILRRQVPFWLEQPPLRQIVLQATQAHQRHGGSGALYVYLRR